MEHDEKTKEPKPGNCYDCERQFPKSRLKRAGHFQGDTKLVCESCSRAEKRRHAPKVELKKRVF